MTEMIIASGTKNKHKVAAIERAVKRLAYDPVVVPYDVPVGHWLVKQGPFSGEPSIHSPEQYAARYVEVETAP